MGNGKKNQLFLILQIKNSVYLYIYIYIYITFGLVWLLGRYGKRLHVVLCRLFRKRGTIVLLKGLRDPLTISSLYKGKKNGKRKREAEYMDLEIVFYQVLGTINRQLYVFACVIELNRL